MPRSPEEELSQLAVQSLQGYFRSHPLPSERLAQADRLIAQEGWQDRKALEAFPCGICSEKRRGTSNKMRIRQKRFLSRGSFAGA